MWYVPSQFVISLTLLATILSNFTYFKLLLIIGILSNVCATLRLYFIKIILSCLLIIVLLL